MVLIGIIASAIIAFAAGKTGMKAVRNIFGTIAFLGFIYWLATGPGFWVLEPKVNVPDNIPIPGK